MSEEVRIISERIPKASLAAKDLIDLKKIEYPAPNLLPCRITEEEEAFVFQYDTSHYEEATNIFMHSEVEKLNFLINFAQLYKVMQEYYIPLEIGNLYYDENYILYVKFRDVYNMETTYPESQFIYNYKCFIGGIVNERYTIDQLRESGMEMLHGDKFMKLILLSETMEDVLTALRQRRKQILADHILNKQLVDRRTYKRKKRALVITAAGMACFLAVSIFSLGILLPRYHTMDGAYSAYMKEDYYNCAGKMEQYAIKELTGTQKYMLAKAYASIFKQQLPQTFDVNEAMVAAAYNDSAEKNYEYFIHLGREEYEDAIHIATIQDSKDMKVFCYQLEYVSVKNDNGMSDADKSQKLEEITGNIDKMAKE